MSHRPRPPAFPRTPAAVPLALLLMAACGGGEPAGPPVPTSLRVTTGDGQTAIVGTALPLPITVVVSSDRGPMADVPVRFEVETGGGFLGRTTATTDLGGTATTTWTLGGALGEQRVRITAGSLPAATARATATVGPPAILLPLAGNSQFAVVGRTVAIAPRARVTDAFGNPVAGIPVTFSVQAGGGRITDSVPVSDADGGASLGSWTLGPSPGTNRLRVRALSFETEMIAFGTPATVIALAGDGQSANAGTLTPVRPAVRAADGEGRPLAGVRVDFVIEGGQGSVQGPTQTTDSTGVARVGGWVLGLTPGANALSAQVPGVPPLRFNATGVPAVATAMASTTVGTFAGLVGNYLSGSPAVRLTDAAGNPVAGQQVTFTAGGGGQAVGTSVATNFDGRAAVGGWRLGPATGDQALTAAAAGVPPVSFTATASAAPAPAYHIEVRYLQTPTPSQQAAFDNAIAKWQQLILGDLPDIPLDVPASPGCRYPALQETVDDLLIFAELVEIDGPGNILGSAGPCLIRSAGRLTIVGIMRFDTADLTSLEASGRLEAVILHEMGHVIGIGSLWNSLGLTSGFGGGDPFFLGGAARGAFLGSTATGTYAGNPVPVENTGGSGTRDVHWREAVLTSELMTGFLNQGSNPLSAITVASLRDMGYVVDDARGDPFTLAALLQTLGAPPLELREAPLPSPIFVVSPGGRITTAIAR